MISPTTITNDGWYDGQRLKHSTEHGKTTKHLRMSNFSIVRHFKPIPPAQPQRVSSSKANLKEASK